MSQEQMEDLPVNPRLIAAQQAEEKRHQRAAQRKARTNAAPASNEPKTQTQAPQLSTTQRRRNQAEQPRETDGKYAGKPESKWKHFLPGQGMTVPVKTHLKKKPAVWRHGSVQATRMPAKKHASLSKMMDRNPVVKLHWWVTRGFRQWRRKKARQIRKAFSLRG